MKRIGKLFFAVWMAVVLCPSLAYAGEEAEESFSVEQSEEADADAIASSESRQAPSIEGVWEGDGEDWRYRLPDGNYLERNWLQDGGHWYYLDGDGYMVRGVKKIQSVLYYFLENGAMAVGWAYDADEDCWYHAEETGELTIGWLEAGGAWYWFDSKGIMYNEGFRMVSGHKFYFFENGQMAADQFVELNYYNEDGLRDRQYDVTVQGKRRPEKEEKERITEAMAEIPREWIRKFVDSGWELMFYTDKSYFSAPKTEDGIYYVYHQTDTRYKKLKFCNPDSLALAFGEYVAWETGNDKDENEFMADYAQYMMESSMISPLPSYYDGDSSMQFGHLFESYCKEEVRAEMRRLSPSLFAYMEETLGVSTEGRRPDADDLLVMDDEPGLENYGQGPASDTEKKEHIGPGA